MSIKAIKCNHTKHEALSSNPSAGGLVPVILATWEAEIRRILVQGQPGQLGFVRPYLQNNYSKIGWRCGSSYRVPALQVWRSEFNSSPQSHIKKGNLHQIFK
jgi:hypothetical protein